MKVIKFLILSIIFLASVSAYCQDGIWTWMKGDSIGDDFGNPGIQGIPSPTDEPEFRYACGYWTDTAGNFWIFGGADYGEDDIWKFDLQTVQWSRMKGDSTLYSNIPENINASLGIYNSQNTPGGRGFGMFTWITADNHFWLYGGASRPYYPDLWQFDPAINQWAWMGGGLANYGTKGTGDSTTMPGVRCEGNCAWLDYNGNLWLFGGCDSMLRSYNDVWEYNISKGIWTWMSGSSNPDDSGSYGFIGQPSANNYPSARSTNLFWKDGEGIFWLTGGTQYTNDIMFQDIWKFNPQTLEWTWISGMQGSDTSTFGVNCTADPLNKDGPRYENRANWQISDDLIITYDGFKDWEDLYQWDAQNVLGAYKVSATEWIKINSWPAYGSYGVQGVASPDNHPPTRLGSVGFKDKENNIWMFGGSDYNDLWKYIPDTACINAAFTGLQQVPEEEQVLLYPNPCATGSVQLTVGYGLLGSKVEVYDIEGQLIAKYEIPRVLGAKCEIPVSGLTAGVYFLSIVPSVPPAAGGDRGPVVRKLVKL